LKAKQRVIDNKDGVIHKERPNRGGRGYGPMQTKADEGGGEVLANTDVHNV